MVTIGYCLKCKKKVEIKNAQPMTVGKYQKPALGGQCAECGGNVQTLIKKESTEAIRQGRSE